MGMNEQLKQRVEYSIAQLRKGEQLALALNPDGGYYLAFSGGKDSQVLMELCKMAGVRFTPHYSVTSIDPPDNVYFIRQHYPDVIFDHPKENFFRLIEKKGLPTMQRRYCCERLKEGLGSGNVVLTGVRAAESRKRASYAQVEIYSRRKEHATGSRERTIEQIMENEHQCIKGKDRVMLRPVLYWTEEEVWEFIKERELPVNPCYESVGRVGCMFCPFATKGQIAMYETRYPGFKKAILRALDKYWLRTDEHMLPDPHQYYEWWKTKMSVKRFKEFIEGENVQLPS